LGCGAGVFPEVFFLGVSFDEIFVNGIPFGYFE